MREQQVAEVFVELADTLVDDFDLMEFLHRLTLRCADLLGVTTAGLLLTDQRGTLRVVAASTEQTRLLELLQSQTDRGPCVDCFHTGRPVTVTDLPGAADRWPEFVAEARQLGFTTVHALPMRLRAETIGALNLFDTRPGPLSPEILQLGRALADVATIGLLQARAINRRDLLAQQLQTALNSRVILEQAKGVIAERHSLGMDRSFDLLRDAARSGNRHLSDLARAVIDGSATL